ncbi:alpha/beta hydrolase [Mycolicibacterium agri]|uniref:Alpha/beta hydrolase n=1 Tax=Mycolicibacterium agri TaxID=36811 RepID=A0A2A7NAT2_MYCAG|nr:alpha/beta hydrolase [Mycolicibacterium agri]PEG41232.1 alpha/beta hydrolase [Mycolicibacterium agri]GFG55397.1 alpha/beta hydrolase [Mycolicibacterium agri]
MTTPRHVVLIHGTWSHGDTLGDARREFEARGFSVHTPTLRYHDLPRHQGAPKVASVSVRDYADDIVGLVESLDSPPLLVGHSLGGLIAQLVAARASHAGLVAATPAPAAGIFAAYPGTLRVFGAHYVQWRPWAKPLYPTSWKLFRRRITNTTDEDLARELFAEMVPDSGRVYCEMPFWFLDRAKATKVDFAAITTPVLAVGAERDRLVHRRVARATAKRYANGEYVEIPASDHLVFHGRALPLTMARIDEWMSRRQVLT